MFLRLLHWLRVDSAGPASAGPAKPDSLPQVDRDALLESVGDDIALLRCVVDAYQESRQAQLSAVQAAIAAAEPAALFHAAHQVRGCMLSLCAGPAADLAGDLEAAGRSGRTEGLDDQLEELARRMDAVEIELSALISAAA